MMFAGSTILPATRILDDAILMGSIGFLLAMTSVFGLHLLIAEGFLWSAYSRRIDPLALLPIPSNWAFYLKVIDAMISDPMALFFTIPLLAAFASGAENPTFGFLAAGLILPSILAMISATRLLALKFAVTFLNPEKIRGLVRLGAYQALIITIFLGGWFIYDLFTLA